MTLRSLSEASLRIGTCRAGPTRTGTPADPTAAMSSPPDLNCPGSHKNILGHTRHGHCIAMYEIKKYCVNIKNTGTEWRRQPPRHPNSTPGPGFWKNNNSTPQFTVPFQREPAPRRLTLALPAPQYRRKHETLQRHRNATTDQRISVFTTSRAKNPGHLTPAAG